jgi:predicted MPP superfamily phosphohydrolase
MSAEILTAIIAVCAVFVLALCALVYWYAFRLEPINFKVSNIIINLIRNTAGTVGAASKTGKHIDISDNTAGMLDKTLIKKARVTNLSCKVADNTCIDTDTSANSKSRADRAEVSDFTILHLSDFHLRKDRKGEKLFNFVRSLSSYNPDFIFITGDLVEKNIYFDFLVEMLKGLNARTGKYAVFGVHDYYNKTPKEFIKNMIKRQKEYRLKNDVSGLISKLESIGIKVLRNERVSHALNHDFSINISGLEDSIIDKTDIDKAFGKYIKEDGKEEISANENNRKGEADNKKASYKQEIICGQSINKKNNDTGEAVHKKGNCQEETINKGLLVLGEKDFHNLNDNQKIEICLTHTPDMDLFSRLAENGVDIILSGHTHGGQVRLPGIGAIISGCNIKAKYASGLFYFKKFVLYVSRGLGEGRYSPFRFYCPPEATFIKVSFTGN